MGNGAHAKAGRGSQAYGPPAQPDRGTTVRVRERAQRAVPKVERLVGHARHRKEAGMVRQTQMQPQARRSSAGQRAGRVRQIAGGGLSSLPVGAVQTPGRRRYGRGRQRAAEGRRQRSTGKPRAATRPDRGQRGDPGHARPTRRSKSPRRGGDRRERRPAGAKESKTGETGARQRRRDGGPYEAPAVRRRTPRHSGRGVGGGRRRRSPDACQVQPAGGHAPGAKGMPRQAWMRGGQTGGVGTFLRHSDCRNHHDPFAFAAPAGKHADRRGTQATAPAPQQRHR